MTQLYLRFLLSVTDCNNKKTGRRKALGTRAIFTNHIAIKTYYHKTIIFHAIFFFFLWIENIFWGVNKHVFAVNCANCEKKLLQEKCLFISLWQYCSWKSLVWWGPKDSLFRVEHIMVEINGKPPGVDQINLYNSILAWKKEVRY